MESRIRRKHGIRVVIHDVPDPSPGDLNGAEIHIDYLAGAELRLFLLSHLFGHTVQWNVSPLAFALGQPRTPPVEEPLVGPLIEYEREAACYGYGLLLDAGVSDCGQWLADFTACDMAYLAHYYRTGEQRGFSEFWRSGQPLLEPRPAPPFTPTKKVFRIDGIVI